MREILFIGGAGAIGALARYLVNQAAIRWLSPDFPWGTLIVNLSGSLLLGILLELSLRTPWIPPTTQLALATGFLGAFTTFSTFSVESVKMAETSGWPVALANVFAHVALGLLAAVLGMRFARLLP